MNPSTGSEQNSGGAASGEVFAARFAQMVIQQANMAMILLGKVPHPQTGETMRDMEGARMFIDQLEMLEAKTKGNLSREEDQLLKQSLMALHMAFVEALESPAPAASPAGSAEGPTPAAPAPETKPDGAAESPKKFSKKY